MNSASAYERRRSTRVHLSVPVELHDDNGFTVHSSHDLSEGGAFFDRSIPYPVGARLRVCVRLPNEPPIDCEGEVVNVPIATDFGMGVRFRKLTDTDRRRLAAFTQVAQQ